MNVWKPSVEHTGRASVILMLSVKNWRTVRWKQRGNGDAGGERHRQRQNELLTDLRFLRAFTI
jgi:hypothetical protein